MRRVDGKRGPIPKKRMHLKEWVRREIVRGHYPRGSRLPDRDWFMSEFATNRKLVQQAFDELKAEGFVRAVPGHGTLVATRYPFEGRYLVLVKGVGLDAGAHIFAAALEKSTRELSAERGISFDIRGLSDAPPESADYARILEDVRAQRYAGVFVQGLGKRQGLDTVTNVDDVPSVFLGPRNECTQGSLAASLCDHMGLANMLLQRLLAGCAAKGCKRIALFAGLPVSRNPGTFAEMSRRVAEYGLELVPNGYHTVAMDKWDQPVFRQLVRLVFASDAGRAADAVVLADDNFLRPFAEELRAVYGEEAIRRYALFCLGNAPLLPETGFPVEFHGIDWKMMLASFVDYCESCRTDGRRHPAPRLIPF